MIHDYFELLAAKFVVMATRSVSKKLISVVFASPLSARSPDLCMLWHPGYRNRHSTKLFFDLLFSVALGVLKGFVRLVTSIRPFGYAIYGKVAGSILVVPSICGSQSPNGEYKTAYVETVKEDALFVYGPYKNCGKNSVRIKSLSFLEKLSLIYSLAKSGLNASVRLDCKIFDKVLLLLKWLSWSLSLQWLHDYYLEISLSETVEKYDIQKIGCIHEMHFYSRIVWRVAKKYNAKGHTIQHAAFSNGKRWYFCFQEEIESGLMLPDVMYVYSDRVSNVLKQYYEKTSFYPGCSIRYSHWKDVEVSEKKGKYYLFAGALAAFDNDVLITTLRGILQNSTEFIPVKLRLHPFAKLSYSVKRWIRLSSDKGIVAISKDTSLRDDIEDAIVVLGMSTTVLEEALLLGRPVVQILHPDFREYIEIDGVKGAVRRNYRNLLVEDIIDASTLQVDHQEMRKRLGLNNSVVSYKRLFVQGEGN